MLYIWVTVISKEKNQKVIRVNWSQLCLPLLSQVVREDRQKKKRKRKSELQVLHLNNFFCPLLSPTVPWEEESGDRQCLLEIIFH